MFERIKQWLNRDRRTLIERRMDEITESLRNYDDTSDNYRNAAENLRILAEADARIKAAESRVDRTAVFNGVIALVQIILILIWEERHVLKSKALSFITKLWSRH